MKKKQETDFSCRTFTDVRGKVRIAVKCNTPRAKAYISAQMGRKLVNFCYKPELFPTLCTILSGEGFTYTNQATATGRQAQTPKQL